MRADYIPGVMLSRLQFEWFFFRTFGLLPAQATFVAWSLPFVLALLAVFLVAVWLWRARDGAGSIVGCCAAFTAALVVEAQLFEPGVFPSRTKQSHPDLTWLIQTFPKECLRLVIAFPLLHGFVLYFYRAEVSAWLAPRPLQHF